jgi:hypothetical protein
VRGKASLPITFARPDAPHVEIERILADEARGRRALPRAAIRLVHRRIHSLHFEASPKANECVKRCTSNLLILVQFTTQTLDLRACRECESSVCVTALVHVNGESE